MAEAHTFTFERLNRPASESHQPYLKLLFFVTKSPSLSDEEFHRHWETIHADLTVAAKNFQKIKILRYVQVNFSPYLPKLLTVKPRIVPPDPGDPRKRSFAWLSYPSI